MNIFGCDFWGTKTQTARLSLLSQRSSGLSSSLHYHLFMYRGSGFSPWFFYGTSFLRKRRLMSFLGASPYKRFGLVYPKVARRLLLAKTARRLLRLKYKRIGFVPGKSKVIHGLFLPITLPYGFLDEYGLGHRGNNS